MNYRAPDHQSHDTSENCLTPSLLPEAVVGAVRVRAVVVVGGDGGGDVVALLLLLLLMTMMMVLCRCGLLFSANVVPVVIADI